MQYFYLPHKSMNSWRILAVVNCVSEVSVLQQKWFCGGAHVGVNLWRGQHRAKGEQAKRYTNLRKKVFILFLKNNMRLHNLKAQVHQYSVSGA